MISFVMFMMKRKSIPNDENKVPDYDENRQSMNITHKLELWKTSKKKVNLNIEYVYKRTFRQCQCQALTSPSLEREV